MAMYFCMGCQSFKDNDWQPMSRNELCPGCEIDREEARIARAEQIRKQHMDWEENRRKMGVIA